MRALTTLEKAILATARVVEGVGSARPWDAGTVRLLLVKERKGLTSAESRKFADDPSFVQRREAVAEYLWPGGRANAPRQKKGPKAITLVEQVLRAMRVESLVPFSIDASVDDFSDSLTKLVDEGHLNYVPTRSHPTHGVYAIRRNRDEFLVKAAVAGNAGSNLSPPGPVNWTSYDHQLRVPTWARLENAPFASGHVVGSPIVFCRPEDSKATFTQDERIVLSEAAILATIAADLAAMVYLRGRPERQLDGPWALGIPYNPSSTIHFEKGQIDYARLLEAVKGELVALTSRASAMLGSALAGRFSRKPTQGPKRLKAGQAKTKRGTDSRKGKGGTI